MHLASIFQMVAPPNMRSAGQIKESQGAHVRTGWSSRILSIKNCKTQNNKTRAVKSRRNRFSLFFTAPLFSRVNDSFATWKMNPNYKPRLKAPALVLVATIFLCKNCRLMRILRREIWVNIQHQFMKENQPRPIIMGITISHESPCIGRADYRKPEKAQQIATFLGCLFGLQQWFSSLFSFLIVLCIILKDVHDFLDFWFSLTQGHQKYTLFEGMNVCHACLFRKRTHQSKRVRTCNSRRNLLK